MKHQKFYFLAGIVVLAFFLRVYRVVEVPPSLNWDEVSIGYNAYSILKTGRDEWGEQFPVFFKSYGEYKLPVQIYGSIPGIAIFGLNDFGVRITPVIYGTLTVLIVFLLGSFLFRSSIIGLISAFLLAISPWHLHLTRASFESSFALFWFILGLWLLVKGTEKSKWWLAAVFPLAVSIYTYNTERVFVPLFLAFLTVIFWKSITKSKMVFILAVIIFVITMIPMVPFIVSGQSNARYKLVSITDDPGLVLRINESRGLSKLPSPLPVLIHNKVTYTSVTFINNYLSHFTPQFLFLTGAPHKQHHVQGIGQLYLFQAPFLLLGLYLLFKRKERYRQMLVGWVLLAFIPVSVTNDSIPHALRTLVAVPAYQFFSAYGIYAVFDWIRHHRAKLLVPSVVILTTIIGVSCYQYFYNYHYIYPVAYSRDWQYGYKQIVDYIDRNKDKYDLIIFTRSIGEPHMFTLFYLQYDPYKYQTDPNLNRFETHDWIRVLNFDKYYFPDLTDEGTRYFDIIRKYPNKKLLFIGKPIDFPDDTPRVFSVKLLNGNEDFDVVEVINAKNTH